MKNREFSKKIHKVAQGKLFFYFDPIIILDVRRGYWFRGCQTGFYRPETMRHEKIALKIKSIVMRITNNLRIMIIQFSFLLHYF